MEASLKIINLSVINAFVTQNTMGYRNLNRPGFDFPTLWNTLFSNLLTFWKQYFIKKKFYLLDHIKPFDLDKVSPIFRNQISLKNKKIMRRIFSKDENIKVKRRFISLNKIVPKFIKSVSEKHYEYI